MAGRLRVISGSAGGLFLKSPKRHELRPTQDRIRQVIFSSLADKVVNARVLDLFAGTGAIGIEALSRGAASATFVEENAEAVACIQANLQHCRLENGTVRKQDVFSFLNQLAGSNLTTVPSEQKYDLVFADPPYEKSREPLDLKILSLIQTVIVSNGYAIIEHYSEQPVSTLPGWEIIRQRSYGETGLTYYANTRNI